MVLLIVYIIHTLYGLILQGSCHKVDKSCDVVIMLLFCRLMIQVDIGGHPPFPNGSKQFSGHFGNLLFLAGFNFRGHFEGPNEGFSRSRFSMIAEGMIEAPK
jgi:hypothetical protein